MELVLSPEHIKTVFIRFGNRPYLLLDLGNTGASYQRGRDHKRQCSRKVQIAQNT